MLVEFLRAMGLLMLEVANAVNVAAGYGPQSMPGTRGSDEYVEVPTEEGATEEETREDGISMMQKDLKRKRLQKASEKVNVTEVMAFRN